jgi:serine/threonine-protein kinase
MPAARAALYIAIRTVWTAPLEKCAFPCTARRNGAAPKAAAFIEAVAAHAGCTRTPRSLSEGFEMLVMEDVDFTGHTVDHYVILGLIRAGAQGRVYRGRDQVLHREVAIKVLNPATPVHAGSPQDLITEARALSSLNHPNVAGVYDFVTHDRRDFMVMEFIAGATLEDVLAGGPLPFTEVARLGSQLARGLAAAHAAHIAHGDIKPANLKITSSGVLKIVDFGVATRLPAASRPDAASTVSHRVVGTLPYMAPELLHGASPDQPSDIFSVGAVLYEMATGCRAFPQHSLAGLVRAIENGAVTVPSRVNPAVPTGVDRVILRALRNQPSARYRNAVAVAEALESLISMTSRRRTRRAPPPVRNVSALPQGSCVAAAESPAAPR